MRDEAALALCPASSWPGEATKLCFAPMSRPSTSFLVQQSRRSITLTSEDVDHRDKPGDDDFSGL
jgi:hypothetical protein